MEKSFLDHLRKKNIFMQVYYIRNKSCTMCGSLANRDAPEVFRNIDGYKIYFIQDGVQLEDIQRLKDRDSPIIEMELGFYAFMKVFRCEGNLIIYVHVTEFHHRLHPYRIENLVYTLYSHMRILGVPQKGSIFTSWDNMEHEETKQIPRALRKVESWTTNPEFKIEQDIP